MISRPAKAFSFLIAFMRGVVFFCIPSIALGLPNVMEVTDTTQSLSLGKFFQVWVDETSNTTVETILTQGDTLQWQPIQSVVPNFGFDRRVRWYRVVIHNVSASSLQPMLEIDYPMLDHVELFQIKNNLVVNHEYSGDMISFFERKVKHHNLVFALDLPAEQQIVLYMRVQTEGSHQVPSTLWAEKAFYEHSQNQLMLQSFYFGIMFVMITYNLFLFFVVKDLSYIFYVMAMVAFATFQADMHGFTFQYLWPQSIILNDLSVTTSLGCFAFASAFFVIHFLRLKENSANFHRLFLGLGIIYGLMTLVSMLIPYHIAILTIAVLGAPGHISAIVVGIFLWFKGHYHIRYFVAGWMLFMFSVFIQMLNKNAILPVNFFTEYIVQIGNVLEVVLFSFALADRINAMQIEKNQMERDSKMALLDANRSLAESVRLKDEFLTTISHELRTPMNGVLGSLENMTDTQDTREIEMYRNAATASAHEMMLLVESILGYSEIKSGQLILQSKALDIGILCDELQQQFSERASAKGLRLTSNVDSAMPLRVIVDDRRLMQILSGLLDNAIKFTQAGHVALSVQLLEKNTESKQVRLRFSVKDSGIGVGDAVRLTMFQQFRQLDSSSHRRYGGLGIGLAVSQALAQAMGSEVICAPAETLHEKIQGSCFYFSLDLRYAECSEQDEANLSRATAAVNLYGHRVLVVEDNRVNQLIMMGKLQKLGAAVLIAEDGQKALELIQQQAVDLVLMDCQMPVMDGFEATRQIRLLQGQVAQLPIIAVTANAMSKDRQRCLDAGMNDYLTKPVDSNLLLQAIQKWLHLSSS